VAKQGYPQDILFGILSASGIFNLWKVGLQMRNQ